MKANKPKPGDRVTVTDSMTDEVLHGICVDLLSKQFTFEDESGKIHYCFYIDYKETGQ